MGESDFVAGPAYLVIPNRHRTRRRKPQDTVGEGIDQMHDGERSADVDRKDPETTGLPDLIPPG